jgi:predicted Na+-dependent transporter
MCCWPHFSGNESLEIVPSGLIATLLVTQLLPLRAGLLIREFRPALADKLKKPFDKGSKILNLVAFALILYAQFHTLKQIKLTGFFGMLILFVVSGGLRHADPGLSCRYMQHPAAMESRGRLAEADGAARFRRAGAGKILQRD